MKISRFVLALTFLLGSCTFDPGPRPGGNPSTDAATDANNGATDATVVPDTTSRDTSPDVRITMDTGGTDTGNDVTIDVPTPDMTADVRPDLPIQNICDGIERDLDNDDEHCGRCNNACDTTFGGCSGGQCQCPLNTEPCGALNTCTDTEFDPNNCGGCGIQCSPGQFCVESACVCRSGYTLCNGECVDTERDPRYCGNCTTSCNGGPCNGGECSNDNRCGLPVSWRCEVPNEGIACVQGQSNHLYCNPSFNDACGTVCTADEFCYDPGFGRPTACYKFRPAINCQSCPCNECTDDEACNVSTQIPGEIFCIEN